MFFLQFWGQINALIWVIPCTLLERDLIWIRCGIRTCKYSSTFSKTCYVYWVVIMYFIPYVQRNLDFIFSRYLWFTCQVILHDYFYRIWEDYLLLSAMHYATINLIVFKGRKYYSACVVIFHDTFWPLISVLYFICDTCIWTTFQYKTFLG